MNKKNGTSAINDHKKLKEEIQILKRENRRLKTEIKTLESAWQETEAHIKSLSSDKKIEDLIKDKEIKIKDKEKCKKCKSNKVNILQYKKFKILICKNCSHKEKIEERSGEI